MSNRRFQSTILEEFEAPHLQSAIREHNCPGWLYVPPGRLTESISIGQNGLGLIGAGEDTILESNTNHPAVTITAPNVRIADLAIRNRCDTPAIAYTSQNSAHGSLHNVTILESDSHGIVRNWACGPGSRRNEITDCELRNIGGHGIVAESESGGQSVLRGNRGTNIDGAFVRWEVTLSYLVNNRCDDAPIHLTSRSGDNVVKSAGDTRIINDNESNRLL